VGYWWSEDEWVYPHPKWLVQSDWRSNERENIVSYLQSGHEYLQWLGYSWCRCDCGIAEDQMGDSDLTDGEWVWPQGLAHYVERHSVRLPDEFIGTMRSHAWRIPESAKPKVVRLPLCESFFKSQEYLISWILRRGWRDEDIPLYDISFWLNWCHRQQVPPEKREKARRWWQLWR
jgi:hypothetical protein